MNLGRIIALCVLAFALPTCSAEANAPAVQVQSRVPVQRPEHHDMTVFNRTVAHLPQTLRASSTTTTLGRLLPRTP